MNAALTPCPACQGEGSQLAHEGQATEHPVCCDTCNGEGALEVCASCKEVPTIEAGREMCPCVRVQVAA